MEALKRELDRGYRSGNQTSVILADIDYFKQVNDTHGHVAGDGVLQEVAAGLCHNLRSCDWIGRYGGEEFLIVLPETTTERAELLAERLRETIAAHSISVGDKHLNVTLSLGVDGTNAYEHSFVETLILNADTALYEAKRCGRNRVQRFGQPTVQGVISNADTRCALSAH
jgi:diguanylate cyclase (GGDEF)-like protein